MNEQNKMFCNPAVVYLSYTRDGKLLQVSENGLDNCVIIRLYASSSNSYFPKAKIPTVTSSNLTCRTLFVSSIRDSPEI
jgi:hypothetical protein